MGMGMEDMEGDMDGDGAPFGGKENEARLKKMQQDGTLTNPEAFTVYYRTEGEGNLRRKRDIAKKAAEAREQEEEEEIRRRKAKMGKPPAQLLAREQQAAERRQRRMEEQRELEHEDQQLARPRGNTSSTPK